jgi:hypothetical protein
MRQKIKQKTQAGITLDLDDFDIIEPNPFELDKESIVQPRLVFAYLKEKAETQARIRGLKSELKVAISKLKKTDARLNSKIRRKPSKYKVVKITDTNISNTILIQDKHIEAEKEVWRVERLLDDAENYHNLLEAAAKALDNRKAAIENLIVLQGRQYYANPKIKDDNKDMINKQKNKRTQQNRKMKQ